MELVLDRTSQYQGAIPSVPQRPQDRSDPGAGALAGVKPPGPSRPWVRLGGMGPRRCRSSGRLRDLPRPPHARTSQFLTCFDTDVNRAASPSALGGGWGIVPRWFTKVRLTAPVCTSSQPHDDPSRQPRGSAPPGGRGQGGLVSRNSCSCVVGAPALHLRSVSQARPLS